jgi:hypothetical protein
MEICISDAAQFAFPPCPMMLIALAEFAVTHTRCS